MLKLSLVFSTLTLAVIALLPQAHADEYQRQRILTTAGVGLHAQFGDQKGEFSDPDLSTAEQLGNMLGGPPAAMRELRPHTWLLAACRAHSCDERGVVIVNLDSDGLLIGAWRHFHCRHAGQRNDCDAEPSIETIEFPGLAGDPDRQAFRAEIAKWADANRANGP